MPELNSGIELASGEDIARFIHDNIKDELMSFRGVDEDDGTARFEKLCFFDSKAHVPAPTDDEIKALAEARGIDWKDGYETRAIPYIASDERVDSYGDIVRQSWIFDSFAKNPVMPYSHNWHEPPVANGIDWKIIDVNTAEYVGKALYILSLYPDAEVSERADSIYKLVKAGFLKGGSVGFWAGKAIWVEDEEERKSLGLGKYGLILEDNHLLEFSPTTIPANDGALTLASAGKRSGLITPREMNVLKNIHVDFLKASDADEEEFQVVNNRYQSITKTVFKTELEDVEEEVETKDTSDFEDRLIRLESSYERLVGRHEELTENHKQLQELVEGYILERGDFGDLEIPVELLSQVEKTLNLENI